MTGWGVLIAGPDADGERPHGGALRECFEGLVVVPDGLRGVGRPTRLDYLRTGLREVPPDVGLVTLVDDESLALHGTETIGRMMATLTAAQAGVVRALPVTDALKRVADRVVMESVDRTGLFVPQTPQVLRRGPVEEALAALPPIPPRDPATLLVARGHALGVVWSGASPAVQPSPVGPDR